MTSFATVGLIGFENLGQAFCQGLMRAGFDSGLYTRNRINIIKNRYTKETR